MAKLLKNSENDTPRKKKNLSFIQQIFIRHYHKPGMGDAEIKTSAILRQIKVGDWPTSYQTFCEALVIKTGDTHTEMDK